MSKTLTVEIDFLDEACELEITYALEDGAPNIYSVALMKQVAQKGEVWYGSKGELRRGPHWIRQELTDFLSRAQVRLLAADILEQERREADEDIAEIAADRFCGYRETGYFTQLEPSEYAEAAYFTQLEPSEYAEAAYFTQLEPSEYAEAA